VLPINIEDLATRTTDRMVVVLRRAVYAQPVASFGHAAAQTGTDKGIEGLVHRRKGQRRMIDLERRVQEFSRWMTSILLERR
jgi:hypothetical protein